MRAAIYTRVSQDRSGTARSVTEQEADCRAVAERNGWTVVEVFCDNDRSASRYARKERPEFAKLVRLIEGGGADVLVTWEASRSSRDLEVYVRLRELCRERGVLWSYSGRTFDMSRTDDRMVTGLDALLAERESDQTRERVLRAVRATAEAGRPHGRLLYGYRRTYRPTASGKPELVAQEPDPATAPVVVEAARRVLSGETCYAVAEDFNARGIPSSHRAAPRWDLSRIKRLVTNPGYAGLRVHRGKVIGAADWPSLIPEADHLALVRKLADPGRDTRGRRESNVVHLMSGIAECGECDGVMRVLNNRGTLSYVCKPGKGHVSRSKAPVDELIEAVMVERLRRLDLAALTEDGDQAAQEQRDALAVLRNRLDEHYALAAAGELSARALAAIEPRILSQIEAAERALASMVRSPLLAEAAGPDAERVWAGLQITQKRELIRLLMSVRLLKAGAGHRTFDPELIEITWQ
mgnify:CR=1 FL=1